MQNSELAKAKKYLRSQTDLSPKLAIILGSGLGPFADELENRTEIATADIPNYPVSTVSGHAGKWIFGEIQGKRVLALQGRVHSYEGYSLQQVTFPVHLMADLGIEKLIITNAAGGHNRHFQPGDLMLITDHINLMFDNPLFGINDDSRGPRFPDMSQPYDRELMAVAEKTALELGIKLHTGVLTALKGPTYETAAEVRMIQRFGGDAGTMSTIPEVIAAVHRGLRVLGISCITNLGTGLSEHRLSHDDVTEVAQRVRHTFTRLVQELVVKIA